MVDSAGAFFFLKLTTVYENQSYLKSVEIIHIKFDQE